MEVDEKSEDGKNEETLDVAGAVVRSKNEQKFDRQTRLWGQHGQNNIQNAHVCVLGAGPTATESLKNLVLPNIGAFTVVDGEKVSESDLGNNFFVTADDVGKNRAEVVRDWLVEMNPICKGTAVTGNPTEFIQEGKLNFFDGYTVVVATQMYGAPLKVLAKYLYDRSIPLLIARSNGLLCHIRLAYKEFAAVESHPTNDRTDLYLHPTQLKAFPELATYLRSFDLLRGGALEGDQSRLHTHVPFVAIIVQFADAWIKEKGSLPDENDYKAQDQFKQDLQNFGNWDPFAANYREAKKNAWSVFLPPRVDSTVRAVLEDPAGGRTEKASFSDFWILVRSLRDFMEKDSGGVLPVTQDIPDMTSLPEYYVKLKELYKEKFEQQRALITGYVRANLVAAGREEGSISHEEIDRFCRHVRDLKVARMRSLEEEEEEPDDELWLHFMDMGDGSPDEPAGMPKAPKDIQWHYAIKACDAFVDKHGRIPGGPGRRDEKALAEDSTELLALAQAIFKKQNIENEVDDRVVKEVVRFGGAELHNTGAFTGGVVSQAILKLVLKQFCPLNNTFVWNGIHCQSSTFKL